MANLRRTFAAFLEQFPMASWLARGVLGVRVRDDRVVVSRAADGPLGLELPRALVVDGLGWPITVIVARAAEAHGAPSGGDADDAAEVLRTPQARAGASLKAEVEGARSFGTLGMCFIGSDDHAYLISNWHVLCGQRFGAVRDGRVFLARSRTPAARLHGYARVRTDGPNTWDLAIARFERPSLARGGFRAVNGVPAGLTAPCTLAPPRAGEAYFKVGARTGYREARFAGEGAHAVALGPDPRGVAFVRLSFFESLGPRSFSSGGDSGSVVVHARSGAACALLVGGFVTETGSVSIASPLHEALHVVGRVRTAEGEVLPRLDYPAARAVRGLEWVRA